MKICFLIGETCCHAGELISFFGEDFRLFLCGKDVFNVVLSFGGGYVLLVKISYFEKDLLLIWGRFPLFLSWGKKSGGLYLCILDRVLIGQDFYYGGDVLFYIRAIYFCGKFLFR